MKCIYCSQETIPKLERKGNTEVYICSNSECGETIDRALVERKNIPRTRIGFVGFSGHGKTVYLISLVYMWDILEVKSRDFKYEPKDTTSFEVVHSLVPEFKKGKLPGITQFDFLKPTPILLNRIPGFGNRFLIFYDVSGEVYEKNIETITDRGRYVAQSDVVIFFISITKSGDEWQEKIRKLLSLYTRAVYNDLRIDIKKRQHCIVVFSKSDELISTTEDKKLSDSLIEFLQKGSYEWYLENAQNKKEGDIIADKLKQLKKESKVVEGWLKEKGCAGFIKEARDYFKSVEYTIVSSTGAACKGMNLAAELTPEDPKRVLDPFFWILEKSRPRTIWERLFGG
jgi:predicted RNA-binding protein with TRAM domain